MTAFCKCKKQGATCLYNLSSDLLILVMLLYIGDEKHTQLYKDWLPEAMKFSDPGTWTKIRMTQWNVIPWDFVGFP